MNVQNHFSPIRSAEPLACDLPSGDPRSEWPFFGLTDDIRPALARAIGRGETVALATLYAAEGGAPRGVGAQMLISEEGASGYLSGGCIEADVALHARAVIADGKPRRLVYGRGGPIDIRLPCGGRIEVLVEQILPNDSAAERLLTLAAARRPALWISNGIVRSCNDVDAGSVKSGDAEYMSRLFNPRQRLVVLGADPISLALCRLGLEMGYEVFLVRPKGPSSPPAIGDVTYIRLAPAEALASIGPDKWTAVAVGLHDELYDHEATLFALNSEAGYVGLLGSRRRLSDKLLKLRAAGLSSQAISGLSAPIGLPLGGRAPWEIATSIIAEIIERMRGEAAASGSAAAAL